MFPTWAEHLPALSSQVCDLRTRQFARTQRSTRNTEKQERR